MSNGPNNSEISRSATALIDADTLQPIEAKTISTSHTSQEQQDLKMPVDDGPQPASTTADNKLHQRQSSHVQTSLSGNVQVKEAPANDDFDSLTSPTEEEEEYPENPPTEGRRGKQDRPNIGIRGGTGKPNRPPK